MKADYVIVGGGSAGCVLANRLSVDPKVSVILLEAGPANTALSLKMPAAMLENLKGDRFNWAFRGEPEPGLNGRHLQHDRGKTLGGSSSINGMVFIRGHAYDFETWRQMGCVGWGYADVLPYFKKLESYPGGDAEFHGQEGPMQVTRPESFDPLTAAFLKAGEQAGYPITNDINGYKQEGFGSLDRSVHGGERWSTARGYLEPAEDRPNLQIVTGAKARRVVFDGNHAHGVLFQDEAGVEREVTAQNEVILSAGVIGTPHLLMLSGIGPEAHLQDMGIKVLADRQGVGQNLNDHPDFVVQYACTQPVTLFRYMTPVKKLFSGVQWFLARRGVCASNHFEGVACLRSGSGVEYPDLQLTLSPIAMKGKTWQPIPQHAFQLHVGLMRAHSRGEVTLRDGNPDTPPRILVNYLDDPRDRDLIIKGIRMIRGLVDQPAFAALCGEEITPGRHLTTDEELGSAVVDGIQTQWHLSGTAKMGLATDPHAVVDKDGIVYGVTGLRVVDASIMPQITNGNTNCPTIMIAEKLSDAILGKAPMAREEREVWQPER